MKKTWGLAGLALVTLVGTLLGGSNAHTEMQPSREYTSLKEGFLPPNEMKIPPFSAMANGMTEQKFNAILDRIQSIFTPKIRALGANFVVQRYWSDPEVNSYASRSGSNWIIRMLGGLARHPAMTEDGFALVACHEVGHHIGGNPRYRGEWAANEGQSDYFANLKCLRELWKDDPNEDIVASMQIDPTVKTQCEKSFGDKSAIALCERESMAGLSSARVSQALGGGPDPDFARPDPSVVNQTFDRHPAAQCRLDTYFNGSVCQVSWQEPLSETDPTVGTCSVENNYKEGVRPLCWYKPGTVVGPPGPGPTPPPTPGPSPTYPPNPPPTDSSAPAPTMNGQTVYYSNNPDRSIMIDYDVSGFQAAGGVYFEMSNPNRPFLKPNGIEPDPFRLLYATRAGAVGGFIIVPRQHLPGWGTYYVRVIPLDGSGQRAVGRFSNSSQIILRPSR